MTQTIGALFAQMAQQPIIHKTQYKVLTIDKPQKPPQTYFQGQKQHKRYIVLKKKRCKEQVYTMVTMLKMDCKKIFQNTDKKYKPN